MSNKKDKIEIYKIVFLKTNRVMPDKEIEQKVVLFESRKKYESFWRLHTKRPKDSVRLCGFELSVDSKTKQLCWSLEREYPIPTINDNNHKKQRKQYTFDFMSPEETKTTLINMVDDYKKNT